MRAIIAVCSSFTEMGFAFRLFPAISVLVFPVWVWASIHFRLVINLMAMVRTTIWIYAYDYEISGLGFCSEFDSLMHMQRNATRLIVLNLSSCHLRPVLVPYLFLRSHPLSRLCPPSFHHLPPHHHPRPPHMAAHHLIPPKQAPRSSDRLPLHPRRRVSPRQLNQSRC